MGKKTYREVLYRASSFLNDQGKEGYAIQYLFFERKGWSKTDWLLNMNQEIPIADEKQLELDLERLMQNYPPQYLLGEVDFYGRKFKVTEATLIPRPETEELVDLCLKENEAKKLKVVDIGTGTGVIAITLKTERPDWHVSASDISAAALAVADENAKTYNQKIDFGFGSVLEPFRGERYDLIISNPPYISESEWDLMDESVRTYEPKPALFAENNGLAIYQQIAKQAKACLKADGKIYLEIGFQQAAEVKKIFAAAFPEKKIEVRKDLTGNDRIVVIHS